MSVTATYYTCSNGAKHNFLAGTRCTVTTNQLVAKIHIVSLQEAIEEEGRSKQHQPKLYQTQFRMCCQKYDYGSYGQNS